MSGVKGSRSESNESLLGMGGIEHKGVAICMAGGKGVSKDRWLEELGRDVRGHWMRAWLQVVSGQSMDGL